jgi:myosin heavy subunit
MTSRSAQLPAVSRASDFDPTVLEPGAELPNENEQSLKPFSLYVPDENAVRTAAIELFGGSVPDAVIRNIIADSEEIAHSTRKIIQEHMRMGGNFLNIKRSIESAFVAQQGDKKSVRDRAAHLVYQYIEKVHGIGHQRASLYMRTYEKFIGNDEAMALLKLSDMQMLLAKDTPDELVDIVVRSRKENPDLSKLEVKALIDNYRKLSRSNADKDEQIQVATAELSAKAAELDEAHTENKRLIALVEQLKQDNTRDRKAAEATMVELKSASSSVSVLQQELAKLERELDDTKRQAAAAESKVQVKEVEKEVVPEAYRDVERKIEEKLASLREVQGELDSANGQLAELEQRRKAQLAQLEATERLEQQVSGLIESFASFTQQYHTAQLMVTADGHPERFRAIFQALVDIVGKFHTELSAAAARGD